MRRTALVVAMVCFASRSSRARADGIRVEAEACGLLDLNEVERLVALDLASVIDERKDSFPPARVICLEKEKKLRIVIEDPITEKKLERTLPLPGGKGRERTFALAISQLYLTSWAELTLPPPPEPVGPPPNAAGSKAAVAIVQKKVVPPPTWSADAILSVSLRLRGGHGLNDVGGAFRAVALSPSGFGGYVTASFESMRVERTRGNVDASLASIGAGGEYRSRGMLAIDARAGLNLVFVRVDGRPTNERTISGGGLGTALDLSAALGPILSVGPFRLGVEGQVGVLVPRVTAEVRGEDSVSLHGPWVGAAAFVGMGF
jgi:hypothetical protein